MTVQGGCLCGAVRYEISGPLGDAGSCYCSMCRRAHGAAFGTYAKLNENDFKWLSGEEMVAKFESSPNGFRCFCRTCGSPLGAGADGDKLGWVTLGTIEGDPGVRPQAHIFVGSKAPWYEITDGLPQFEEWPPGQKPGQSD
ncbi:MAG: GFA family protein [Gammaproteobacteria bacterium]|nr:GFA family protein [Gammaproteobacteria bacterium]